MCQEIEKRWKFSHKAVALRCDGNVSTRRWVVPSEEEVFVVMPMLALGAKRFSSPHNYRQHQDDSGAEGISCWAPLHPGAWASIVQSTLCFLTVLYVLVACVIPDILWDQVSNWIEQQEGLQLQEYMDGKSDVLMIEFSHSFAYLLFLEVKYTVNTIKRVLAPSQG